MNTPGQIPASSVLIVDDEKSIRLSLREFLVADGYKVEVAADAQEALRLLDEQAFDVVVSDIVLPGINGIELLKTIRAAAPFAQVIMVTGDPTVDTAAEALRAGAFDYLSKPVGKSAILRAVGNAARIKAIDDERRRLEKENRAYQQNLEKLVEERTAELQQAMEDLKNAQNEIIRNERLNALAQLAAGICHDFNNVLMPICGLTEHLVSHPETLDDKEESLRLLGNILSASNDAKEIVRRMREFYRPREAVEMAAVDVDRLFRGVGELTRPKWGAHVPTRGKVTFEIDAADVPAIAGQEAQLREALTNLVLNAVDAMPQGGTVRLRAELRDRHVVLNVEDTGEGMPAEIRRRCLEPFFTTKGDLGTGMGLAMVHGIVKRHGGTLEIESEMGKGTTIALLLPLAGPEQVRQRPESRVPTPGTRPLRILVIDDEEWSRTLISGYLQDAGCAVKSAEDGAKGVAKAAGTDFDIVITDRLMPGMSGEQVAVAVKKSAPQVPVLLLTGDIINAGEGPFPGIDAVLEKPVTQREVVEMVDRLTARTTGGTERETMDA
ncbi:MAG: response regulator [Lentisphaerae bacterium]|nr:response regulator [Lentisphaerota bacterium]